MTSEQSLTSRDFPVHWPVHTRWTDNDMFGHLNNAVYYALFDTAINAWINTSCEIDPLTVSWLGVVAESGCKYLSELKFPNPLVVGLAGDPTGQQQCHLSAGDLRGARRCGRCGRALGARVRRPHNPQAGAHSGRHPSASGKGARGVVDMLGQCRL